MVLVCLNIFKRVTQARHPLTTGEFWEEGEQEQRAPSMSPSGLRSGGQLSLSASRTARSERAMRSSPLAADAAPTAASASRMAEGAGTGRRGGRGAEKLRSVVTEEEAAAGAAAEAPGGGGVSLMDGIHLRQLRRCGSAMGAQLGNKRQLDAKEDGRAGYLRQLDESSVWSPFEIAGNRLAYRIRTSNGEIGSGPFFSILPICSAGESD
jgi:hypothetical protein